MVRERKEYHSLSDFSVSQAYPAWKAGLFIDDHSSGADSLQLPVTLTEQLCELLVGKCDEAK
jgi:hypothetical protein